MSRPPESRAAPCLIVNADDLGLSVGINRAIFEGHDRGIVTSTSLMATGSAFDDAIAGLRSRPRLGAGVHLVLHDDFPAADPARIPTLVGPDGRLRALGEALRGILTGAYLLREIEIEYAAQIQRVVDAGIFPTHMDSHCHLHALPPVGPIVHALGHRFGIACARSPEVSELADFRGSPLARFPLALFITASQRVTRRGLEHPLRTPDRFIGLVKSGEIDAEWVVRAIESLPAGRVSELMVHPGDGSGDGDPYGDHGPARRRGELDAVTNGLVLEAIGRCGVTLVDYRHLSAC